MKSARDKIFMKRLLWSMVSEVSNHASAITSYVGSKIGILPGDEQ